MLAANSLVELDLSFETDPILDAVVDVDGDTVRMTHPPPDWFSTRSDGLSPACSVGDGGGDGPHTIMDACGPYSGAMLGVHCRPRHLDGDPPDRVPVRAGPVKSAAPLQH